MRPVLCAVALLAACSTAISEADCRGTDWYQIGLRDGMYYGLQPQNTRYAEKCAPYGVKVSDSDYMRGWREGFSEFSIRTGGARGM